eukprot:scaffold53623_cov55-Attheya_sp.AAC.4
MAITRNPHTYSGILFDLPLMEASEFRSLAFSFRWFALVSFGGKKLLRVFVLITFLRKLVLGAFFLDLGAGVAGIWAVLGKNFWMSCWVWYRILRVAGCIIVGTNPIQEEIYCTIVGICQHYY